MTTEQFDINDDVKRDVLAATDLVGLIGAVTALKKAGASWKGLCPFHTEKTPSFLVHPEKGYYYCFGCGAKGDAISFVRETERMEFPEAVAYLARRAGVSLPVRRSGTRAERSKETRTAEALGAAAKVFARQLSLHPGVVALLAGRGIGPEEAARLGFGAALDSWDALKNALSSSFPEEVLVEAGLLSRSEETGRLFDRFRNRLTIEIRDGRGEIVGFGARALADEVPKYVNSPEGPRFSKGRLLYGLDRARGAIRKKDEVILVEGYFDQVACERAGLPHAVASMGTALTPAQADLLVRQAPRVVVTYDGDAAGQAATLKAFALLVARGAAALQLVLPPGHDPDSWLRDRGPEALRQAREKAVGIVSALAARVPPPGADPALRAERIREAAGILACAPDRVLRYELLSALAREAAVPLEALQAGSSQPKPVLRRREGSEGETQEETRLPETEEKVLSILMAEWPESRPLCLQIPPDLFSHPVARAVFEELVANGSEGGTLDFLALASHLEGAAERWILGLPGREGLSTEKLGLERISKSLQRLTIRLLEEKGKILTAEIGAADAAGSDEDRDALFRRKDLLGKEVQRLWKEWRRPQTGGRE
jgi:DNA primase catalytic core